MDKQHGRHEPGWITVASSPPRWARDGRLSAAVQGVRGQVAGSGRGGRHLAALRSRRGGAWAAHPAQEARIPAASAPRTPPAPSATGSHLRTHVPALTTGPHTARSCSSTTSSHHCWNGRSSCVCGCTYPWRRAGMVAGGRAPGGGPPRPIMWGGPGGGPAGAARRACIICCACAAMCSCAASYSAPAHPLSCIGSAFPSLWRRYQRCSITCELRLFLRPMSSCGAGSSSQQISEILLWH